MVEPALRLSLHHAALCFGMVLLLSACSAVDYQTKRNFAGSRDAATVMTVSVDYDATKDPYEMQVNKIRRGYELQAPMRKNGNATTHMTVSHTSDRDWFVGPRLSFSF